MAIIGKSHLAVAALSLPLTDAFTTSMNYPRSSFLVENKRLSSVLKMSGPEIEVISQPDEEFLKQKGVFDWGTWGCGVSKFPWSYDSTESCYLLAGKVTVTPSDGRQPATFEKGDFVTFPAGMSCTWDVTEAVQKHFMFF